MPVSVLVADVHQMFRAGLKALLEEESSTQLVGEAGTGDEAVEKARELEPEVVLMDLSMPETDGLKAARRISALDLDTHVLVLTVHAEEEYLVPVVEAGASGCLTKNSADRELVEAIRVVAGGEVYLPPAATKLLLSEYKASEDDEDSSRLEALSDREQEVLALTAGGYSSREIGEKLSISPKTVDTYRSRVTKKLELNHRSELVRFALRAGLLQSADEPSDVSEPGEPAPKSGGS